MTGNKFAAREMSLSYIAPTIHNRGKIVELYKDEIQKGTDKWKMVVILYVVGDSPTIGAIERLTAVHWNFMAKSKVFFTIMMAFSGKT